MLTSSAFRTRVEEVSDVIKFPSMSGKNEDDEEEDDLDEADRCLMGDWIQIPLSDMATVTVKRSRRNANQVDFELRNSDLPFMLCEKGYGGIDFTSYEWDLLSDIRTSTRHTWNSSAFSQ